MYVIHKLHELIKNYKVGYISLENKEVILVIGSANERRRYILMSIHIGWAHTQNDHCNM